VAQPSGICPHLDGVKVDVETVKSDIAADLLLLRSEASASKDQGADSSASAPAGFDYGEYDPAVAEELRDVAVEIRERDRNAKAAIVDIGGALSRIKEKVGHGNWGAWLAAEFEMSSSTAERYMRLADRFGDKIGTVTNLPARLLYAMAAKSAPVQVVDQIVARLEAGDHLPAAAIESEISEAKRAADRAAEKAKMKRQRQAVVRRCGENERLVEAAARARAERDAAVDKAAEMIIASLGDRLHEFVALLDDDDAVWLLLGVLREQVARGGKDELVAAEKPVEGVRSIIAETDENTPQQEFAIAATGSG
jgi:hypothetical protein